MLEQKDPVQFHYTLLVSKLQWNNIAVSEIWEKKGGRVKQNIKIRYVANIPNELKY